MRRSIFSRALLLFAAIVVCLSCTKEVQEPIRPVDGDGEIRTLSFGIQPQTRTSLTFETSGVKLNWQSGDRIAVVKGDAAYIFELESTGSDGKGVFKAVGKGIPDLTGNTEKISIYHISGDDFSSASTSNKREDVRFCTWGTTQTNNDNYTHLNKDCLMQRVLTSAPTKASELEGNLTPVNSVFRFEIAAPTEGLVDGEYPTSFIFTVSSIETSFLCNTAATDQGFDLSRSSDQELRINKMQVTLKGITEWNASNPLKTGLNIVMDNGTVQTGDSYIFEVQTNLGNIYSTTKAIKSKPEAGKIYNISLSELTKDNCSTYCSPQSVFNINPVAVKLYAKFNPHTGTYYYGKTFWNMAYSEIIVVDPEKNPKLEVIGIDPSMVVYSDYVTAEKGIGKGGAFEGEGYLQVEDRFKGVAELMPNKKYMFRPCVSVRGNSDVYYYGPWQEFTTQELTIKTDGEGVNLGTGVIWANYNVGASKPEEVGDYYAWGETTVKSTGYEESDYKYYEIKDGATWSINKYIMPGKGGGTPDNKSTLESNDDAATKIMKGSWRMPTKDEMQELYNKTTKYDMTYNGVRGMAFVGKNANTGDTYGNNCIFIPYGGYKWHGNHEHNKECFGLWSSTLGTNSNYKAYAAHNCEPEHPDFKTNFQLEEKPRCIGFNVRAVKAAE